MQAPHSQLFSFGLFGSSLGSACGGSGEAPPAAPVVIRTGGTRKPGCDLLKPYTLADVAAAIAQSRASATKA